MGLPLIQIFLFQILHIINYFKFYILLFIYTKLLFSLKTTYGIPFLQIHVTNYFFLF